MDFGRDACRSNDAVGNGNVPAETIHAAAPAVSFKQDLEKFELEVERRLNALDVRMAKLQTLELRVAKLEDSLDGGHRDMDDTRDVNEGIITDVVEIITNRGSTKSISAEVLEASGAPTSSQAINTGGPPRFVPMLRESFWDAIFVSGLGGLGITTTFLVMVGTLVSICSRSVFCWIVFSAFATPDAKYDAAWLVDWRLLVGHSIHGYDANSDSSLVSRACRGKPFDREWWAHSLLNEIDDYLTPMFSEELTVGFILSSLAVAIWLAYIAKELQRVATLILNLCAIPKGPTLVVDMHHARATAHRHSGTQAAQASNLRCFHSMSTARRSFLLLTLVVRAVLAALLGFCGALWLCRTRDIEKIIQNGVALVFVLEIDELLFELFAPLHASRFVISMARYEQSTKAWVYNLASVLQLLAYLGICLCFVWLQVSGNIHSAMVVREIICGGNQDFIIESHTKVGPIFVTDTSPFEDGNLSVSKL